MTPNADPWYATNAARGYPLDDAATGVSDDGVELPDDVLVDLAVAWAVGAQAPHLGAVTAAGSVAGSGTVVVCAGGAIVAFYSGPATVNTPVRLQAPDGSDAGHAVFGPGAFSRTGSWRFSGLSQSRLAARTLRAYRPVGITGVGKPGVETALTGLIELTAGSDLSVTAADRVVDGKDVRAVVLSLAGDPAVDLFQKYAGRCGGRPESNTCTLPPLEFVRAVPPDCAGDLKLVFESPLSAVTAPGLVVVTLDVTLEAVCRRGLPAPDGTLPGLGGSFPSPPPLTPPPPPGPLPDPIEVSSSGADCAELPHCALVGDGLWQEVRGAWADATVETRPECPGVSLSSSSLSALTVRQGSPTVGRAVAVWYDCGYDGTVGRSVTAAVRPTGPAGRAGVVVGYETGVTERYVAVEIDAVGGRLLVRRWNGAGYVVLATSGAFAVTAGDWYAVQATVTGSPGGPVLLTAEAGPEGEAPVVSVVVALAAWPLADLAGVCAHGAAADFAYFRME